MYFSKELVTAKSVSLKSESEKLYQICLHWGLQLAQKDALFFNRISKIVVCLYVSEWPVVGRKYFNLMH